MAAAATITATDAATLANANALNTYTTGQVTLNSVQDTVANITTIDGLTTSEVTMAAATVSITDTGATKTQVDAVNAFTTGTVTPTSISEARTAIATLQGTTGISLATTNITVTDQVTMAQADTINGYTTGQVILNSVSDTVTNLATIESLDDAVMKFADDGAISVSDAATLANANTINGYTTGQVTLTSVSDLSLIHI